MTEGPERPHGNDLPVDSDVPETTPAAARRRALHVLRERWDILLVIAAGGALGSLARWAVTEVFAPKDPWHVPWGTSIANVSGALALGLLMVFVLDVWPPHRYVRPFLAVGVLGGYTTFSTYMLDTHALLAHGEGPAALGYLFGTLVTGLVAVGAGVLLARLSLRAAQRRHHRLAARHEQQRHTRAANPRQPSFGSNPGHDVDADPTTRRNR